MTRRQYDGCGGSVISGIDGYLGKVFNNVYSQFSDEEVIFAPWLEAK